MPNVPVDGRGRTVLDMFKGHRYQLDYYQRDYTWRSDNVRRLVDDLYNRFNASYKETDDRTAASRYRPYFLGPYVYFQDGEITYLVDGQQRITTLHLLLILIRNLLKEQDETDDAAQVESLIRSKMYGQRRYAIDIKERVRLLDALMNGDAYVEARDDHPSVRTVWERYGDLEDQFPPDLKGEALPYFSDWLLNRVGLVGIEASDREHGWEIFETMNDRGLQLSPLDLLKSFLLGRCEPSARHRLNEKWRGAITGLSSLDRGLGAATDFVKALLIGQYADLGNDDDLKAIDGSFHEWIRGNYERMKIYRAADFADFITEDFAKLAEVYCALFRAAWTPDARNPALHHLFFNNVNGIRNQFWLILAAARRGDSTSQIQAKARRVAAFLDIVYVRQIIAGHSAHHSDLDRVILDLIPKVRAAGDLDAVTKVLSDELAASPGDFADIESFSLGPDNRRQVHYLLSRLTEFVDTGSKAPSMVGVYLDEQRTYQIEHIWADHFDRYKDLTKTRKEFDKQRNRFGALLLLDRAKNAAYRDEPYSAKVGYYRTVHNHLLAASLHPDTHRRNPDFRKFLKKHGLETAMRPYPKDFNIKAIDDRQKLYRRLCQLIWDPKELGFTITTVRKTAKVSTRANYKVEISDLLGAGLLKAGDTIAGTHKGTEHTGSILADGRIKLSGGELFTAVSPAAAYAKQTKSANGWDFWHRQRGDERRLLKEIRDEYIRRAR